MTTEAITVYEMALKLFERHPYEVQAEHCWTRKAMDLACDGRLYELSLMHHDGDDSGIFVIGPADDFGDREAFGPGMTSLEPRADLAEVIYRGTPAGGDPR